MPIPRRRFAAAGAALAGLAGLGAHKPNPEEPPVDPTTTVYNIYPIGTVHNKKGQPTRLEVYPPYVPALHGLDCWTHVLVLWWFHQNDTPAKRRILQVHPRGNKRNPLNGVFATHAPVRPNLIAITTCKIRSVDGPYVTIDRIDAFDGTPILDLKSAGTRTPPLH